MLNCFLYVLIIAANDKICYISIGDTNMRMRKKPNLIPRMERCARVQVKDPAEYKGRWLEGTPYKNIYLEIGCGKGRFTAETAKTLPDTLYIAVEKVPDAMVVAMERVCADKLENVRFIDMDANKLCDIFAPGEVSRIYINFCDPWPSNRHAQRRLTAPGFLEIYEKLLPSGGEIHFKTDNLPLFNFSLTSFKNRAWETREVTNDLHKDAITGIMTDYEEKFHNQGIHINRCVAVCPGKEE